jgi:ABC-type Fe3+-siderophore transport system permease subunit
MLLFYLLFIDMGAYGFGFRWPNYPTNVFVIMLICMAYYLVRVIWSNAYIGPEAKGAQTSRKATYVTAAIAFAVAITISVASRHFSVPKAADAGDNGALILFIISAVSLVLAFIVSLISKKQNKEGDE